MNQEINILETHPWQDDSSTGIIQVTYQSQFDGFKDQALVKRASSPNWVVVIHGHGSNETQLFTREDIKKCWLPQFEKADFNILTVNLRGNAWMNPDAVRDLHGLLTWLRTTYQVEKLILFSGSMGGTSNLIYAIHHPEDIDALVSLGAATDLISYLQWCLQQDHPIIREIANALIERYGSPDKNLDTYQAHSSQKNYHKLTMPIYFAHGGADATIPVSQARDLAALLKDNDSFKYVEIENGNHDSPLWDINALPWIMSQLPL